LAARDAFNEENVLSARAFYEAGFEEAPRWSQSAENGAADAARDLMR
jgi:hypothetical protein